MNETRKQIDEELAFLRNNGKPAFCLINSFIRPRTNSYEILVGVPSDVSSDNFARVIVNKQRVQFVKENYESDMDDNDKYHVHDPSYVIRIDMHKSLAVIWFNRDGLANVLTHDTDGNVQSVKMTGSDIMKAHDRWLEDERRERERDAEEIPKPVNEPDTSTEESDKRHENHPEC